jgi:hypothetical protein
MKNVTEMTIEELNAERTKLNELDQAILAGASNANEHDLYERLDLIVQEIADREEKNAKQISITKMLTAIEDIQNCFKDTPALRVFVRQLPPHIALEMKDELDELIQTRDLEDIKAQETHPKTIKRVTLGQSLDDYSKEYTAQLSIGRGTMASTMVLSVAFQKNRDAALTALIEKIISEDDELALQMNNILDAKIQERDEAMIGLAEINCEERSHDDMDGDHASALASAGWGTDEDYA